MARIGLELAKISQPPIPLENSILRKSLQISNNLWNVHPHCTRRYKCILYNSSNMGGPDSRISTNLTGHESSKDLR